MTGQYLSGGGRERPRLSEGIQQHYWALAVETMDEQAIGPFAINSVATGNRRNVNSPDLIGV